MSGSDQPVPRIAVVDDEEIVRREIQRGLARENLAVEVFADGESALERLAAAGFDVVVSDLRLPGIDGLEILRAVQRTAPATEVIIMTAFSSVDTAIEAIQAGAFHYVTKPVKIAELRALVRRALDKVFLMREKEALKQALFAHSRPVQMVGHSAAIEEVLRLIDKVAPLDCNVLIQGESGTGKEMIARALHDRGPRRRGPFVSFNCGGFTEEVITNELFGHEKGAFTGASETKIGLLEAANGGSILLDEIEEMPISMQVKLLRFVEERTLMRVGGVKPVPVDLRLIAAGNRDLKELVKRQAFREDLYYRLNVVVIDVPPLRERLDDVPLLIGHFLEKHGRALGKEIAGVSQQVLEILSHYPFPGNVRELENIVERAVALSEGPEICVRDLPSDLRELSMVSVQRKSWPSLQENERDYIRAVLAQTNHNRSRAADILGVPRTTLWRKMKRYGLD